MWPLKRKKAKTPAKPAPRARAPQPAARKPEADEVLKTLDTAELSIDGAQEEGFDPYNSGIFDRSKIWESWQRRE